ncbi:phospholipase C [Celerinatantimonas diazotrophica]|uniref:Phospholipase C n=1 Tax=Celerinatantimonas diazotrophica TaxID=412034 RepID=A0A4R1K4N0_9GAMM|nr:alkaline phosphatase family protein [Celerinatantimonas diazotrophica]TCK58890.1 phospholipase C [Celerinatantimonas diazotrophica]CAG9297522.1 Phospholipase C 3 [Celerinatantimonas diazotrophica]
MKLCKLSLLALAVAGLLQGCADPSSTTNAWTQPKKTATPIKHVVVIFDENISFDHYFGTYPHATNPKGEPAFHAKADTPAVNGLTPELLTHNPNQYNPFRMVRNKEPCDQDHGYEAEQDAYNGGLVNQFVSATGNKSSRQCQRQVMGYYDGNTVTALWNYAQNFAMSDNSYGTIFGPSTPGALNLVAGQTGPTYPLTTPGVEQGNLVTDIDPRFDDCSYKDVEKAKGAELATSVQNGLVYVKGQNVGNLLNANKVSWGWFEGGFDPTSYHNGVARCGAKSTNVFGGEKSDYIPHHEPFQYYQSTANPHHLPPTSIAKVGQTDQANHQYSLKTFWKAARMGNLPAVSFLKPKGIEDGHAGYSNPIDEQHFLVRTINRLEKLPQWKNMAIIIAYDDSDGYYDHVMPPKNHFANQTGRAGYGPRLPLLVISPYAKQNFVDHTLTGQSSIIRFIEDNWHLGRLKNSMDSHAGVLNNMFDFKDGGKAKPIFLNVKTGEKAS